MKSAPQTDTPQPETSAPSETRKTNKPRHRHGKVARLPKSARDTLNRMLLDGAPYAEIITKHHLGAHVDSEGHYSFNGLDTIRAKTQLADSQQLGGIMIWELGQDTRDDTSLLRAIHAEAAKR